MSFSTQREVIVVVFDNMVLLDATGPMQVLHGAGGYLLRLASLDGCAVRTDVGVRLEADIAWRDIPPTFDTLIVPGASLGSGEPASELVDAVRDLSHRGRRVVAVCTGALLLAEAGLLNGRRVTTHWAACADLSVRFPATDVQADEIFVQDGNLMTSAGVAAGIDAALALVEADHGVDTARTVAKYLVVFLQRPGGQSQFSVRAVARSPRNAVLRQLLDVVVADPAADHRPALLADRANVSERHLSRMFQQHVGTTPARWVEQVRVEAAQTLLEADDTTVTIVARRCGFGSEESMRRAFLRAIGVAPAAYRRRFQTSFASRGDNTRKDTRHHA